MKYAWTVCVPDQRGGRDAEKSHQKAHQYGAQDCWTVIHLQGVDIEKLRQESPSTR
ncbi:XcyI family restriction endonuclease [Bifidobacterium sp. UTBIF-68]|uniref:XcyI family restriction endonuclease n=1 Tax=Bifidobacterium sp. UTBIF-68 TaxID=1465262 RepID=UPI00112D3233